ncbi:zf-HC2 domain-containing protein [Cohnella sp. GCM10027633]|uniref:zf-HC2 domain-containing protein n=1 Tax=unclassified Cohnella TaxID=2636738 RepID=UPI00363266EF
MNCQEVMELMQRHIDGDLNQQETSLMTDHVGRCPECAAMLDRLRRLSNELAQLPRVMPRFSLVDAIMPELNKLDEERKREAEADDDAVGVPTVSKRSERPGRRSFRGLSGVVAMGVIALALVFSSQLNLGGGHSDNDAAMPNESVSEAPREMASGAELAGEGGEAIANETSISDDAQAKKDSTAPSNEGEGGGVDPQYLSSEQSSAPGEVNGEATQVDQFGASSNEPAAPPTAKTVAPTASSFDAPAASETDDGVERSFGIAAATPAAMLVSPDGKWRAIAVTSSGTVQVYDTENNVLVFESEAREGAISHLAWEPDGKRLTYVWTDAQGKETPLAYEADGKQEISR